VRPIAANITTSATIVSQLRRRRGVVKKSSSATAVPPVVGHNNFCMRFSEVVAAVVFAVSVDVEVALPLMATEVGLRVQVGMSLPLVIAVVTAHFRSTVPAKP
jgi:hypothetical protein